MQSSCHLVAQRHGRSRSPNSSITLEGTRKGHVIDMSAERGRDGVASSHISSFVHLAAFLFGWLPFPMSMRSGTVYRVINRYHRWRSVAVSCTTIHEVRAVGPRLNFRIRLDLFDHVLLSLAIQSGPVLNRGAPHHAPDRRWSALRHIGKQIVGVKVERPGES